MMRIVCIWCCLAALVACSSSPVPKNVLKPAVMQKIVPELIQVDEYITNFVTKDSSINLKEKRSILYEQVFKLNGTTKKEFYTSYRYYQQHPDLQKALFDTITDRANRVKANEGHLAPKS